MSADDLVRHYRDHGPALEREATRICGPLAADAVQDAFIREFGRVGTIRHRGWLHMWMSWMVAGDARRYARATRSQVELTCAEPESAVVTEVDAHVRSIVAGLPERQRAVVFLRYYADLDQASIANALGIRRGTVASTLHHAHARVRTLLIQEAA